MEQPAGNRLSLDVDFKRRAIQMVQLKDKYQDERILTLLFTIGKRAFPDEDVSAVLGGKLDRVPC
jgi:hypothetical protein